MTLTTKIVRQYQCCGQVMPVPVVIKKLACWRPPMPLHPPAYLPPAYPYQQPQQPYHQPYQLTPYQHPQQSYQQPYSYLYPANAMQQQQQQPQQPPQPINDTAQNESVPSQNFQTHSTSLQNDSERYDHRLLNYPIVEYSRDISVPTGNIVIKTTDNVPDGYLLCDGTELSREIESTLFSVIGTFYGDGDGINTFCLPDLEDEERSTHQYMIKR